MPRVSAVPSGPLPARQLFPDTAPGRGDARRRGPQHRGPDDQQRTHAPARRRRVGARRRAALAPGIASAPAPSAPGVRLPHAPQNIIVASISHAPSGVRRPQARPDMLWTRASPEMYDLLVLQRGWAIAQYADRLADTLAANLLRAGTAGHGKAITRRSAWRSPAEAMRPSGIPIRRSARIRRPRGRPRQSRSVIAAAEPMSGRNSVNVHGPARTSAPLTAGHLGAVRNAAGHLPVRTTLAAGSPPPAAVGPARARCRTCARKGPVSGRGGLGHWRPSGRRRPGWA